MKILNMLRRPILVLILGVVFIVFPAHAQEFMKEETSSKTNSYGPKVFSPVKELITLPDDPFETIFYDERVKFFVEAGLTPEKATAIAILMSQSENSRSDESRSRDAEEILIDFITDPTTSIQVINVLKAYSNNVQVQIAASRMSKLLNSGRVSFAKAKEIVVLMHQREIDPVASLKGLNSILLDPSQDNIVFKVLSTIKGTFNSLIAKKALKVYTLRKKGIGAWRAIRASVSIFSEIQLDVDPVKQKHRKNDGPVALATVLKFYGEQLDPNDPNGGIWHNNSTDMSQLKKWAQELGYTADMHLQGSLEDLAEQIDNGRPVIVSGHFKRSGDRNVVVTGYKRDRADNIEEISYNFAGKKYSWSAEKFVSDYWYNKGKRGTYLVVVNGLSEVHLDVAPVKQKRDNNCGAVALATVLNFYGEDINPNGRNPWNNKPTNINELKEWAQELGYTADVHWQGSLEDLAEQIDSVRPVIISGHFDKREIGHFVVVTGYKRDKDNNIEEIFFNSYGKNHSMSAEKFVGDYWYNKGRRGYYLVVD